MTKGIRLFEQPVVGLSVQTLQCIHFDVQRKARAELAAHCMASSSITLTRSNTNRTVLGVKVHYSIVGPYC